MSDKKQNSVVIPGDYQYNAITRGPISQQLWHLSKQKVLIDFLNNKNISKICDAGCGSGVIAARIAELSQDSSIYAYDSNTESINFAGNFYRNLSNLTFQKADLLDLSTFEEKEFDLVYLMEVVEHLTPENITLLLKNLHCIGNEEAKYIITTPDYESLWPLLEFTLDTFLLVPRLKDYQHLTKFTKSTLVECLEANHFRVNNIFNFCGLSPFFAHISRQLSSYVEKFEASKGFGNLIFCEFEKA